MRFWRIGVPLATRHGHSCSKDAAGDLQDKPKYIIVGFIMRDEEPLLRVDEVDKGGNLFPLLVWAWRRKGKRFASGNVYFSGRGRA